MAEEPPALSPEMRALLRGYRDANAMPTAAKARVHDRLREPAGRPAWLWAGVGAVAAALLLWGAVSLTGALQSGTQEAPGSQASMQATAGEGETAAVAPSETEIKAAPPQRRAPSPTADAPEPAPLEPAPVEELEVPSSESPAAVETETPDPPRRRPPKRTVTPEPEPAPETPASRLGAENRLIAQTWEHVRAKRYAKARAALAEHARTFPDGVLAPERRALKVIVDCLANPEGAAGKADAYAQSGRTTLLAKVRSACGEERSTAQ